MFTEVWSFYKKYACRQLSDQERDAAVAESQELHGKYKTNFCKELVLAVIDQLDLTQKYLKARKDNGNQE